jgi:dTDP-4-dehydrorhamnose 3,5-epimerase
MAGNAIVAAAARTLASAGGLRLAVPECERGLGAVIMAPESPHVITGVRIEPFPIYPDDRGYFLEVQRMGQGLAADFPPATTQVSAALNFPGTIKAFHFHLHQTDCWTPASGMMQVALVDLRLDSPTFGRRNTMYVGTVRPWRVLIPPGVGHGYKVIGAEEAMLVYLTDRLYNPQDEGRIPYDDPSLRYDWETQRK